MPSLAAAAPYEIVSGEYEALVVDKGKLTKTSIKTILKVDTATGDIWALKEIHDPGKKAVFRYWISLKEGAIKDEKGK